MSNNTIIAAEVIAAFVSNNSIPAVELPGLIRAVVGAFDNLGNPLVAEEPATKPTPAVSIKTSVHHDYLLSLETGEKFQVLRRHLSGLGMTPDQYRSKWGLAADYPMVAPGYSARRSELAKSLGLGRKPAEPVKVSKPRSKVSAFAGAATSTAENVQAPTEAHEAFKKPRSNAKAPTEAETSLKAPETVQEPAEVVQEAA